MVIASVRSQGRWTEPGGVGWRRRSLLRQEYRSKSRRLWQPLRMARTATNSRYQAGMRMPRRIRVSGMERRKLIRSRSVAGAFVSTTGTGRSHKGHRKVKPQARAPWAHFKSALPSGTTWRARCSGCRSSCAASPICQAHTASSQSANPTSPGTLPTISTETNSVAMLLGLVSVYQGISTFPPLAWMGFQELP